MVGNSIAVADEKKENEAPSSVQGSRNGNSVHMKGSIPTTPEPNINNSNAATFSHPSRKEEALGYLLRYETMVRQQEAEDVATTSYMRPVLERLSQLSGSVLLSNENEASLNLHQTISFARLHVALQKLDYFDRNKTQMQDQDFLLTDRQLLMVLRILSEEVEAVNDHSRDSISLVEFIQCYKVCISGMMALQHLPSSSSDDDASISSLRSRTRDRTVSMMHLFNASSSKVFTVSPVSLSDSSASCVSSESGPVVPDAVRYSNHSSNNHKGRVLAIMLIVCMVCFVIWWSWMVTMPHNLNTFSRTILVRLQKTNSHNSSSQSYYYNMSPLLEPTLFPSMQEKKNRHGHDPHPMVLVPSSTRVAVAAAAANARSSKGRLSTSGLPKTTTVKHRRVGFVSNHHNHHHHHHSIAQQAMGGAIALPLTLTLMNHVVSPIAVSYAGGPFLLATTTAHILTLALMGAAASVWSTLCGRLVSWMRNRLRRFG